MTHVLRKSFGPWSAGTHVTRVPNRNGEHDIAVIDGVDIPEDYLVKLRSRTDSVPAQNRRMRRKDKRREAAILERLKSKA